jgi:stage II sporulation protein D
MKRFSSLCYYLFITAFIITGCSSSRRFTSRGDNNFGRNSTDKNAIRVLMDSPSNYFTWTIESAVNVSIDNKAAAIINPGNQVELSPDGDNVFMKVSGRSFTGKVINFTPREDLIKFKGHSYRGIIKVFADNNLLSVVNSLSLEDYLKGVLPLEMPTGNNNENYEALKAFAICARTYSLNKLSENKTTFDVYIDTRDQVYGGVESEKEITNKAVDDTRDLILTYNGQPAVTYYSAACGGHTENVKNVFSTNARDLPYLSGVKDGNEPYCSIAPKFNWVEEYTEQTFLDRLKAAGQIDSVNYKIDNIEVASRFESGRVNELKITLNSDDGDDKVVSLYGNNIRSVIRTSDNRGILRSNMFDISLDGGNVTITGRGNGHGVGLCQWGSIYLSRIGWNYKEILSHYFPGTQIANIKR